MNHIDDTINTITIFQNNNFLGNEMFNTYVYLFLYNEEINKNIDGVYDQFMQMRLITPTDLNDKLKFIANLILNINEQGNDLVITPCYTIPFVIYQSMLISYVGTCNVYDNSCDHNEFVYKMTAEHNDKVWCAINTNEELKRLSFEDKVTLFANTIDPFNLGALIERSTKLTEEEITAIEKKIITCGYEARGIMKKFKTKNGKSKKDRRQKERSNRRQKERNSEINIRRKKTRKFRKT